MKYIFIILLSFILLSLMIFMRLAAMETTLVKVLSVDSGLRITVTADLGGHAIPVPVQLDGIVLIGPPMYAKQKLSELCPAGSRVVIYTHNESLMPDALGVIHGIVYRFFPAPVDPGAPPIPADKSGTFKTSLQVEMIRAGWALYKPAAGSVDIELQRKAQAALEEARFKKLGAYSLPEFARTPEETVNDNDSRINKNGIGELPPTFKQKNKIEPEVNEPIPPTPKAGPKANEF